MAESGVGGHTTGLGSASRYSPVIASLPAKEGIRKKVTYRAGGDGFLQVEYGEKQEFDLWDAFRLFTVIEHLERRKADGILEMSQGFRTLTVRYSPALIGYASLIEELKQAEESVGSVEEMSFRSRRIEIPIAFDDPAIAKSIDYYSQFVRKDAPNVINHNNIEYTAMYNGITVDEVKSKLLGSGWLLVHQLFFPGGTYQLPIDPRSAMEAPKYNPTRTQTPEGAVGLGGQCMYIYTVESPGGYQMLGRAAPTYQLSQRHPDFKERPFLLSASDEIRYVETSPEKLQDIYNAVHADASPSFRFRIEEKRFSVRDYSEFISREDVKEERARFNRLKEGAQKRVLLP